MHTNPDSYDARTHQHYEDEFIQMTGYRSFEIPHSPTKTLVAVRITLDLIAPLLFGVASMLLFVFKHVFH